MSSFFKRPLLNRPLLNRLSVRLIAACFLLFTLLAAANWLIVARGFAATRAVATIESAAALEQQGRELLQQITQREAALYAAHLQRPLDAGSLAAVAFVTQNERWPDQRRPEDRLAADADGQLYDPATDRITDILLAPTIQSAAPAVVADLRDSAALDTLFPSLLANTPDAVAIYFAAPSGVVRYYPPIGLHEAVAPDYDIRRDPTLTAAQPEANPERATVWRAPYVDDAGNGLLVTASVPIYREDAFRGIVGVDISLSQLIARLNALRPTPGAHALLVDDAGRLVAASHGALTTLGVAISPASDTPTEVVGVNLFEAQPPLREALAAEESGFGAAMLEFQGIPVALAHASLPNPRWKLAVIAPLAELTESVGVVRAAIGRNAETTLQLTLAIIALCFLFALLGVVLLSRRWLTQPIATLVEATEAVGRGAPAVSIPHTRRDEIGMLFSSFNRMTAELAASRQQLETRVAERTGELSALLTIGHRVALAGDIDSTLNTLAQSVVEGARAEACAITVMDPDAPKGYSIIPYGLPEGYIEIGDSIPDPEGEYNLWAQAIKTQQPAIMRNVRATVLAQPEHAPMYPIMQQVAWDTVISVPLTYQNHALGTLSLFYRPEQEIDEQQMGFLRAVADQATIAVENARLFRQARESAAVLERQRLARELHDSVSQALYGIALGAQTARAHLDRRPEAAIQPLEYVLSLAKAGMTEMRALIFELRPESLEQEGLVAALGKHVDVLRVRHHIEVELTTDAEPALSLKAKEALYRVAQEALHNIVKHAEATHVQVCLQQQESMVELSIRDNGVGFDAGGNFPGHLGLVSMRERVEKVGGTFIVTSTQGEGSCVLARVQVEDG